VVAPGGSSPRPWARADRITIDTDLLGTPERLEATVSDLQRHYVARRPLVIELAVDASELALAETTDAHPYELGSGFTFLRERLQKAVWHNSYDARGAGLVWWWAHKASTRLALEPGGPADVVGADGTPYWIDGGPRQPLGLDHEVIHHESVDLGRANIVPGPTDPTLDLAPDQLEAVSHRVGPARIIAPAGSGKTRVLTARIRHLLDERAIEPENLTALAYNRRAADEMAGRLPGGSRRNVRTIHSLGWEILRVARPGVRLIDEREQRRRIEPIAPAPPRTNTDVIGPYLEALDEVRIGLRDPEEVEAGRDDVPGFAEVFRRYRQGLDQRGEADHAEQIYGAIEALCRHPDLRSQWQAQCRHLLVDEFQDLTPAYLLLIRLLASPGLNVFGVGDDDQVIYGYAGADPGFLIGFEDLFPGAGLHALEVNYRCPRDVVDGAATLLNYNLRRVEKKIHPVSDETGLEVSSVPGDDLAAAAFDHIGSLLEQGEAPEGIAVLARVNSSLLPLHVTAADRGVPFRSPLSTTILDRTVIRGALAWIRISLNPTEMARNDLFEAVRRPQRGITRLLTEKLGRRRGPFSLNELIDAGEGLEGRRANRWNRFCEDILTASRATGSTSGLLDVLSEHVGLERAAAALDAGRTRADRSAQSDDLTALRRAAASGPPPGEFAAWLRTRLSEPGSDHGVTLSTVHKVKGLEWDHVIVFGVDKGVMPHTLSDDTEEERRIFHVALTRARRTVTVLADEDRPSRFLTEIEGTAPRSIAAPASASVAGEPTVSDGVFVAVGDEIVVSGGHGGKVVEILTTGVLLGLSTGATMAIPWGQRVEKAGAGGRLAPGSAPADPDLLDRLKEWRLQQARRQGVPAYVVFNDRTLEALATRRPTTEEALLGVPGIGPAKLDSYGDDLLDLLV
jgi:DNA helicase-2/ATP-dependent DNA helicase PcrA